MIKPILEQYPPGTKVCMRCKRPKSDQFMPRCLCREGSEMPMFYSTPLGGPVYWRDDLTGKLPGAITACLDYLIEEGAEPTAEQIKLVVDYLNYYICAPCWELAEELAEELHALRVRSQTLATCDEIAAWIRACLDIGIDPL